MAVTAFLFKEKSPNDLLKERMVLNDKLRTPTELVPLPSKGLVYPEDHPFHLLEFVPIKSLTINDEHILLNIAFNKLDLVTSEIIKSCVPLKNIELVDINKSILSGDVAAILYAMRMNSYGTVMDPAFICPKCGKKYNDFRIDLRAIPLNIMDISPIKIGSNRFHYVNKSKSLQIEFKFLTYEENEYLAGIMKSSSELEESIFETGFSMASSNSNYITSLLNFSIISVNGNSDKQSINKFVRKMRLRDSMEFRNYISKNGPMLLATKEVICNDYSGDYVDVNQDTGEETPAKDQSNLTSCDYETVLNLPINHEIFSMRPEHKKEILLEPAFIMSYYAGFSWSEYLNYPVAYKNFYMERINTEIKRSQEKQSDIPTKAPHNNSSDIRSLTGKVKQSTPNAKMQRFT